MKGTLYLPYYDYNDGAFDVSDDYYGGQDYINAMTDEYNKKKDVVFNSMLGMKNGSQGVFKGMDGQMYGFGDKVSQSAEKVAYSPCECILYGSDGEEESVDGFIEKFASQRECIEMVELDGDTSGEEFESEMMLWVREHDSINSYKGKLGEEWAWLKEPKRDVKLHFKNKADEDIYAVLENCRIMDIIDSNMFILFIEKITLVDNI